MDMLSAGKLSKSLIIPIAISFLITLASQPVQAINCYTCSSLNGSVSGCEDPFHPAQTQYNQKCMVPKTGHVGLFPANFCIKIIGTNVETSELMVIRACVMKTMDSQCGSFKYQDYTMKGCILTCDFDGCNSSQSLQVTQALILLAVAFAGLFRIC